MAQALAAELQDQVVSADVDVALTRRLTRIFFRSIARRMWNGTTYAGGVPGGPAGWKEVTWLHPRAVWASNELIAARTLPSDVAERLPADLYDGACTEAPPLELITDFAAAAWTSSTVRALTSQVPNVASAPEATATDAADVLHAAVRVLAMVWPEAADEVRTLIRCVVVVPRAGFYSATERTTFGTLYVGADQLQDVVSAVEVLLHETGHHAMYLRQVFAQFVTNGERLSRHPLRPDSRPVNGILHAGFVLSRIATGLDRWATHDEAPPEVAARRESSLTKLSATLGVLRSDAAWTEQGERLFAALCDQACRLADSPGKR